MWYLTLDNRALQQAHDTLSKALFRLLDTLAKDGQQPPAWAESVKADLQGMYNELWRRRDADQRDGRAPGAKD